jgi:hypothetical protein
MCGQSSVYIWELLINIIYSPTFEGKLVIQKCGLTFCAPVKFICRKRQPSHVHKVDTLKDAYFQVPIIWRQALSMTGLIWTLRLYMEWPSTSATSPHNIGRPAAVTPHAASFQDSPRRVPLSPLRVQLVRRNNLQYKSNQFPECPPSWKHWNWPSFYLDKVQLYPPSRMYYGYFPAIGFLETELTTLHATHTFLPLWDAWTFGMHHIYSEDDSWIL